MKAEWLFQAPYPAAASRAAHAASCGYDYIPSVLPVSVVIVKQVCIQTCHLAKTAPEHDSAHGGGFARGFW